MYNLNIKTSSPVYIIFIMSTFFADSLRDIRRLCDHARVNLALSDNVYTSGNVFFHASNKRQSFYLFSLMRGVFGKSFHISSHVQVPTANYVIVKELRLVDQT